MFTIPGRIPITIYPVFWILAGLIGWMNAQTLTGTGIWIVVIVVSVLIHEFGHALTAVAFGQNASIDLVALGGVTHRKGEKKLKLWQEFMIVLNGPLAGFSLFLVAYYAHQKISVMPLSPTIKSAVYITAYANLFWTILNLVPVHPLDGGQLLRIVMEAMFGFRGIKIALFLSIILATLMGILFFMLNSILAGSIFLLLAFESYRAWQSSRMLSAHDQDENYQLKLQKALEELKLGHREEAKQQLIDIRSTVQEGIVRAAATVTLAKIVSDEQQLQEAYDLLKPYQKQLGEEDLKLFHHLTYGLQHWQEAAQVGVQVYQEDPSYKIALENALSYVHLNNTKAAVGWLQRAIEDGLPNLHLVLEQEAFAPIRDKFKE
ncbi:MAG: M50 family metallopeptidase [Parachlamydiaceae bacterium]|nr:M50 family metallopeptidase [Parachlamydiaceae bacterium]